MAAGVEKKNASEESPLGTADAGIKMPSIEDRRGEELVICLVGYVGAGATTTARIFEDLLSRKFGYDCHYIRVSEIIESCAKLVGDKDSAILQREQRIDRLQNLGNELRKKYTTKYLSKKCVERISELREAGGYEESSDGLKRIPKVIRRAYIIDSIKNPDEYTFLTSVYGEMVWLIGIFAPDEIRRRRLQNSGFEISNIDALMLRDENENHPFGQKVRDTIQYSDFFIRNDTDNVSNVEDVVERYLDLMFGINVATPTQDEAAMYAAYSAASKSACLSRQVGAAIYSDSNELIGIGWNDVPKAFGGLYSSEDGRNDHRCYRWGGNICHNDKEKEDMYDEIFEKLCDSGIIPSGACRNDVVKALSRTKIKGLIEFSRSVHAEMEAIISVGRGGKHGIVGSTLYCTTYPCHNCARHIVASGISRVIFIEPYVKSLALKLHHDAVSDNQKDATERVVFLQYEGTSPKKMLRVFKNGMERKNNGNLVTRIRTESKPIATLPLDGYSTLEHLVVDELSSREEGE